MKRVAALIVIAAASIFLLTGADSISRGKLTSSAFLSRLGSAVSVSNQNLLKQINDLKQENASIKTQLFDQSVTKPSTVKVFSSYPFNNKRDIAIAAGSEAGVRKGDAVTWGEKVLVGKVSSVSPNSSIVSTIFDPSWEMAVRIGESQINALFKGGNSPKAILIPRGGDIKPGDLVITASKDFPYGLEVGKIKDLSDTPGTPFREATLETEVQFSDLRYVTIHN